MYALPFEIKIEPFVSIGDIRLKEGPEYLQFLKCLAHEVKFMMGFEFSQRQWLYNIVTMDIDFLLFNPPKRKINFIDFWGETIFVPKNRKKGKEEGPLSSFLNCYQNGAQNNEPTLTV